MTADLLTALRQIAEARPRLIQLDEDPTHPVIQLHPFRPNGAGALFPDWEDATPLVDDDGRDGTGHLLDWLLALARAEGLEIQAQIGPWGDLWQVLVNSPVAGDGFTGSGRDEELVAALALALAFALTPRTDDPL